MSQSEMDYSYRLGLCVIWGSGLIGLMLGNSGWF